MNIFTAYSALNCIRWYVRESTVIQAMSLPKVNSLEDLHGFVGRMMQYERSDLCNFQRYSVAKSQRIRKFLIQNVAKT